MLWFYIFEILFVKVLIRSIESRDWLNCNEPTSVRSPVKHFIDDLASIDSAIKPFVSILKNTFADISL